MRCGTEWTPQAEVPVAGQPPAEPPPVADRPTPPLDPRPLHPPAVGPTDPEPPARTGRAERRLSSYRSRTEPRQLSVEEGDARPPPRDDETTLRRRRGAVVGWLLTIVLLVALAVAAVGWRTEVMAAWPPSERVYAALGLR